MSLPFHTNQRLEEGHGHQPEIGSEVLRYGKHREFPWDFHGMFMKISSRSSPSFLDFHGVFWIFMEFHGFPWFFRSSLETQSNLSADFRGLADA